MTEGQWVPLCGQGNDGSVLKYLNPETGLWEPVCGAVDPVKYINPATGLWESLCCGNVDDSQCVNTRTNMTSTENWNALGLATETSPGTYRLTPNAINQAPDLNDVGAISPPIGPFMNWTSVRMEFQTDIPDASMVADGYAFGLLDALHHPDTTYYGLDGNRVGFYQSYGVAILARTYVPLGRNISIYSASDSTWTDDLIMATPSLLGEHSWVIEWLCPEGARSPWALGSVTVMLDGAHLFSHSGFTIPKNARPYISASTGTYCNEHRVSDVKVDAHWCTPVPGTAGDKQYPPIPGNSVSHKTISRTYIIPGDDGTSASTFDMVDALDSTERTGDNEYHFAFDLDQYIGSKARTPSWWRALTTAVLVARSAYPGDPGYSVSANDGDITWASDFYYDSTYTTHRLPLDFTDGTPASMNIAYCDFDGLNTGKVTQCYLELTDSNVPVSAQYLIPVSTVSGNTVIEYAGLADGSDDTFKSQSDILGRFYFSDQLTITSWSNWVVTLTIRAKSPSSDISVVFRSYYSYTEYHLLISDTIPSSSSFTSKEWTIPIPPGGIAADLYNYCLISASGSFDLAECYLTFSLLT